MAAPLLRQRRPMDPVDSLMLRQENDPRRRTTITVALTVRAAPDWERLRARVLLATRLAPRLRHRVVSPLLPLGLPVWVDDAELDLEHHLRRAGVPAPGGSAEVMERIEAFAVALLDPARPLWQIELLETECRPEATLLIKVSHALMDGLAGVELLAAFVDLEAEPPVTSPDDPPLAPQLTALGLTAERLVALPWQTQVRQVRNLLALAHTGTRVLGRPRSSAAEAWSYAGSLRRLAATPAARGSALLSGRSTRRRFVTVELSHDRLRAAGRAAGGSLNDAYLAAVLGTVRRYHEEHGVVVDELPVAIPISTRREEDTSAGNRFAGARFAAPVGTVDPQERIRRLRDLVGAARAEPALDAMTALAPVLAQVPVLALAFVGHAQDRLDLQASNVPGPPVTLYLAGSQVTRMCAFGPLPGPAIMSVLVSYAGTCCVGFTLDAAAVTDVSLFERCARDGFREVLALSR